MPDESSRLQTKHCIDAAKQAAFVLLVMMEKTYGCYVNSMHLEWSLSARIPFILTRHKHLYPKIRVAQSQVWKVCFSAELSAWTLV